MLNIIYTEIRSDVGRKERENIEKEEIFSKGAWRKDKAQVRRKLCDYLFKGSTQDSTNQL